MNINIDQLLFLLNAYKKHIEANKAHELFVKKINQLYLEDQIDLEVKQAFLNIFDKPSKNLKNIEPGSLFKKVKNPDRGDPYSPGPEFIFEEIKINEPKIVAKDYNIEDFCSHASNRC